MQSPFSRVPALPTLLLLTLLAGIASLMIGCATERPGASQDDISARPDLPSAADIGPDEHRPPLRYPRLLDDPESVGNDGPSGGEIGAAGTDGARWHEPATDPQIEDLLSSLTLRQRIGQRFIARVQGSRITYGAGRSIVEVAPAGFILYPWNFDTADDVGRLTASLQDLALAVTPGIGLLLCADQEGGRVATFRLPGFVRVPSAHTMGQLGDAAIEAATYLTGLQMRKLGLNMNLAPVLDVYADRSYSGDPHKVASYVRPYLRGGERAGIISVAKHFPGHGISTVDSHASLPVVDASLDEIRGRDLVPFAAAIDAGIDVVMTAHILYEKVDPFYPVTLSRIFLHDLIQCVPDLRDFPLDHFLGAFYGGDQAFLLEPVIHKRFKKLQSHFFRQPALVQS